MEPMATERHWDISVPALVWMIALELRYPISERTAMDIITAGTITNRSEVWIERNRVARFSCVLIRYVLLYSLSLMTDASLNANWLLRRALLSV
jgi:hypothetical protein